MGWQLHTDCSVTELLHRYDQTDRLIKLMWRPLCIAALNTPPERASARVFLSVLRDSLGARRKASDMLIPRVDLTALFPQRAAEFIERHGGTVKYGSVVKAVRYDGMHWHLDQSDTPSEPNAFDAVIIATQPHHAAGMLGDLISTDGLTAFQHEPITTCYLQYPHALKLAQPFFALMDSAETNEWGQFVFDRGQLDRRQSGLLAVVVSASTDAIALGHEALSGAIAAQLAKVFGMPKLMQPQWTKVISEKRATFSCTPDLVRPSNTTGLQGLAIAGDFTACEYPSTLESAVRSGVKAAQSLFV
jgi:squalene-associated FAD-dependent desaturase